MMQPHSPDQGYYWTEQWQAGEGEADQDLIHGRTRDFDTVDSLLDWLQ